MESQTAVESMLVLASSKMEKEELKNQNPDRSPVRNNLMRELSTDFEA